MQRAAPITVELARALAPVRIRHATAMVMAVATVSTIKTQIVIAIAQQQQLQLLLLPRKWPARDRRSPQYRIQYRRRCRNRRRRHNNNKHNLIICRIHFITAYTTHTPHSITHTHPSSLIHRNFAKTIMPQPLPIQIVYLVSVPPQYRDTPATLQQWHSSKVCPRPRPSTKGTIIVDVCNIICLLRLVCWVYWVVVAVVV